MEYLWLMITSSTGIASNIKVRHSCSITRSPKSTVVEVNGRQRYMEASSISDSLLSLGGIQTCIKNIESLL